MSPSPGWSRSHPSPTISYVLYRCNPAPMTNALGQPAHPPPRQISQRRPGLVSGGAAQQRRLDIRRPAHPHRCAGDTTPQGQVPALCEPPADQLRCDRQQGERFVRLSCAYIILTVCVARLFTRSRSRSSLRRRSDSRMVACVPGYPHLRSCFRLAFDVQFYNSCNFLRSLCLAGRVLGALGRLISSIGH